MYYHIYADLVMLSKSTDLEKTAYDMNIHYLELRIYLEEIEKNPSLVLDRYVENFLSSNHSSDELMTYGRDEHIQEVRNMQSSVQKCTEAVEMLHKETAELKEQLESSRKQLHEAKCDVTNEKDRLQKQKGISQKKLARSKELNSYLEGELAILGEQNIDLSMAIQSLEAELSTPTATKQHPADHEEVFTFQTKVG